MPADLSPRSTSWRRQGSSPFERPHWTARLYPSADGTSDAPISPRGRWIFRVSLVVVVVVFGVLVILSAR
jgi:hypothetical protein